MSAAAVPQCEWHDTSMGWGPTDSEVGIPAWARGTCQWLSLKLGRRDMLRLNFAQASESDDWKHWQL
eukprot:2512978-Rhodomonas_salina.3